MSAKTIPGLEVTFRFASFPVVAFVLLILENLDICNMKYESINMYYHQNPEIHSIDTNQECSRGLSPTRRS
jgi:hypothetical protein